MITYARCWAGVYYVGVSLAIPLRCYRIES
jgi:hypothetical protein